MMIASAGSSVLLWELPYGFIPAFQGRFQFDLAERDGQSPRVRSSTPRTRSVVRRNPPVSASG
jgi:hypothetical protein